MTLQATSWAWHQQPSSPMAKFVLVAWSDGSLDPKVLPPVDSIVTETGLTASQVTAAIDLLHLEGVLPAPREIWDWGWDGKTPERVSPPANPSAVRRAAVYPLLVERDGDYCQECWVVDLGQLHIDHVMPRALDGLDALENLQLLCRGCNIRKSAKHPDVWRAEMAARVAVAP